MHRPASLLRAHALEAWLLERGLATSRPDGRLQLTSRGAEIAAAIQ